MGSSKEDDEAGGASGGKSKPGVATVENGAAATAAADSQDLKDQDGGLGGDQNPSGNDYMQGVLASSYTIPQQSQTEDYDDSRFFAEVDTTSSNPIVYFVGSAINVTSLKLIRDDRTGETQFKTQSLPLQGTKFYLDSKIKHLGISVIRLQDVKSKKYINLEETEFKNNFSIFQKTQRSSVPKLRNPATNEWDDSTMSKSILDNVREQPVLPTTTSSRFQLRSPYFTGQQAYFTGQQAYFLRRGYRGW